jgi:hypothetical protein
MQTKYTINAATMSTTPPPTLLPIIIHFLLELPLDSSVATGMVTVGSFVIVVGISIYPLGIVGISIYPLVIVVIYIISVVVSLLVAIVIVVVGVTSWSDFKASLGLKIRV